MRTAKCLILLALDRINCFCRRNIMNFILYKCLMNVQASAIRQLFCQIQSKSDRGIRGKERVPIISIVWPMWNGIFSRSIVTDLTKQWLESREICKCILESCRHWNWLVPTIWGGERRKLAGIGEQSQKMNSISKHHSVFFDLGKVGRRADAIAEWNSNQRSVRIPNQQEDDREISFQITCHLFEREFNVFLRLLACDPILCLLKGSKISDVVRNPN
jgi:hypothetical protein